MRIKLPCHVFFGAISIVASRGDVSFLPQAHPSRLSFSLHRSAGCGRRRLQRRERCAGSPRRRFSVVLVARGGGISLYKYQRGYVRRRLLVTFSAAAPWLRFAAASAFRRPHWASWLARAG